MQKIQLQDFDDELPYSMPIAVIMEKKPSQHAWVDFSYKVIGVVSCESYEEQGVKRIHQNQGVEHYLFSGLQLNLYVDECESYYHNLMSPQPGCFVVAGETESLDEMPDPYLVSLSFDEVHAYLEGDETVYAVDIPPELYKWTEAFVLEHYIATKRRKRKLINWKEQSEGRVVLHHEKQ